MAGIAGSILGAAQATSRALASGARMLPGIGGRIAGGTFNAAIGTIQYPHTRELQYWANNTSTNVVPDPQSIIALWNAKKLTDTESRQLLAYHGIAANLGPNPAVGTLWGRTWRKIAEHQATRHSVDDYLHWYRQKRIEEHELRTVLAWDGYRIDKDKELYVGQWNSIGLTEALALYFGGQLTRDETVGRILELGYRDEEAQLFLSGVGYGLGLPEITALFLRGKMSDDHYRKNIELLGFRDADSKAWATEFLRAYPTTSDLIHFSVREVWRPDIVARYRYDDDFPPEFRHWMRKQGMDWGEPVPLPDGGQRDAVSWPDAYWRSHWQLMSPTQSYTALQRCRPDPANPGMSIIPGVPAFTSDDLDRMLAVNDYAPGVRDWLRAISYNQMRLVDIRAMRIMGIRERAWVVGKFEDRGYNHTDAEDAADLVEEQKRRKDNVTIEKIRASWGMEAYRRRRANFKAGWISYDVFIEGLTAGGFLREEAVSIADEASDELARETVEAVAVAVRRDFLAGKATRDRSFDRLIRIGMNEYHANNLLIRWQAELSDSRIMATTAKIIDWLRRGLLTPAAAQFRLGNLGWTQSDSLLHIEAALQDLAKIRIKEEKAMEASAVKAAKELEKLVREQQASINQTQAKLRTLIPWTQLGKMYREQVITEGEYRNAMGARGYTVGQIDAFLAEIATPDVKG